MQVAKIASEYKPPGSEPVSLSDQRAIKAQEWVEKEVDKLMKNIMALAKKNQSTGRFEVTFGELFYTYQDISDTLVGIMVRAKKRGFIEYEGQGGHMLFQGRHDNVVVTVTSAGVASANGKAAPAPSTPSTPVSKAPASPAPATALPSKPTIEPAKNRQSNPNPTPTRSQSSETPSKAVSDTSSVKSPSTPVTTKAPRTVANAAIERPKSVASPKSSNSPSATTATTTAITSSSSSSSGEKSQPLGSLAAKWAADPTTGMKDNRSPSVYPGNAVQKPVTKSNSSTSSKPKNAFSVNKMANSLDQRIASTSANAKSR